MFEYKGMKTVGVTVYINQTPLSILDGKMSKFNTPQKMKILINVHKIRSSHLQCVNTHYAKFESKRMKLFGVTDYTNQAPSKHFFM